jgi:multidrug efflux pump subunit AcrB
MNVGLLQNKNICWPLLIMTSVLIGISGGIARLYLLNLGGAHLDKLGLYPIQQPFDMITMLGFLVLIGTVVNNPILIVERAVCGNAAWMFWRPSLRQCISDGARL